MVFGVHNMSIKLYIPKRNEKIGLCYDFYQKLMLLVSIKLILPFAINGPPPPFFLWLLKIILIVVEEK